MRIAVAGPAHSASSTSTRSRTSTASTVTAMVSRGWSRPRRSRGSTAPATPRPTWTRSWPATTSTRSSCAPRPSCTRGRRSPRMRAGKHVQVEIPLADSWADAQAGRRRAAGDRPGLHGRAHPPVQPVAPVDPPPHRRRRAGDPADGRADVLLPPDEHRTRSASPGAGPITCSGTTPRTPSTCSSTRPARTSRSLTPCRVRCTPTWASRWTCPSSCGRPAAAICTLSLSFNNDGPFGTFFRYICDNGTYIARYDDLVTGREEPVDISGVDVSTNGIELQDREFVAAIREGARTELQRR